MTVCLICGAAENYCKCAPPRPGGTVGALWPAAAATLTATPGQRPAPCSPPPQTRGLHTTGGHGPPAPTVTLEERVRDIQRRLPSLFKWSQRNDMIMAALEATRREALEEAAKVAGERPLRAVECGYSADSTFRLGQDIARLEARDAIRALIDAPRKEGTLP